MSSFPLQVFQTNKHIQYDKEKINRFINPAPVSIPEIKSSPKKRRLTLSGTIDTVKDDVAQFLRQKIIRRCSKMKESPTHDYAKFVFKDPILAVSFKDRNDVRMITTVYDTKVRDRVGHGSATECGQNF